MMARQPSVAVLGGRSWGTVAATCARNTATVLWAPHPENAEEIKTRHTNSRYLGDLRLAEPLRATSDPAAAVDSDCQPGERPRTTHPTVKTSPVVMKLAAERTVETPIAAQVHAVLNQRQPVGDAYRGRRQPPPGHELRGEAGSDES
jgi:glycerol-3-phosphate dehydrogenase